MTSKTKNPTKTFNKYMGTYNGTKLLSRLRERGIWEVTGEDPNCDNGGRHYCPYIGTYEGVLEDIIRKAVMNPNFWTWGSGGNFKKIVVIPVTGTSDERLKVLQEKLSTLKSEENTILSEIQELL